MMKRATIGLLLFFVFGAATAAIIRPNAALTKGFDARDQTPADRQRQEPVILRPSDQKGPFHVPFYVRPMEEGQDKAT